MAVSNCPSSVVLDVLTANAAAQWFTKRWSVRFFGFVASVLLVGCGRADVGPLNLEYELRAPKSRKFDPSTKLDLCTDDQIYGTRLELTQRRDEGDYAVFSESWLVFGYERRRTLVVSFNDGSPSQVFSLPEQFKVVDWSEWERPSYMAGPDVSWDICYGRSIDRSAAIPPDCFELRYRLQEP